MSLNGNPYGGPRPIQPPLSRSDKIKLIPGFIILGIFAMTSQGQSGSTLYMVNHGFSIAALFLLINLIVDVLYAVVDPRIRLS